MEDIRIVINKSSRLIKSISKRILGNDGENLQENLVFSFEDEFVNGQARLEYVLPDDTGSYLVLTKVDDKYQIPVRSLLLQEGTIHFQLVITEGEDAASIPVFKSNIFKMKITSSLNTVEIEAPAGYASWLELANTKLNQMDNFNISATKSGNTATISVTNRLNQTTSVDVVDGADFQYDWQGTSLGVKNSNEQEYEYVNLKGNTGDKGDKGDKPVKGVDYFTSQDIADMEDYVINSSTSAFNQNATQKTNEFNSNVTSKTESFNTNASSKTSAFDSNATSKMTTFNENATQKTNAFNSNAASKTDDFNTNATTKTTAYNDNATAKTTAFDENAQDKIDEYDEHVEELTDEIEYLQDQVADLSDNQLFGNATGTNINIQDAASARPSDFKMDKESTQFTTTGKNLWGGFVFSKTNNGVNFTYNKDGSITASGTATDAALSMLSGEASNYYKTLSAGTYTISGGVNANQKVQVYDSNGTELASAGSTNPSFTLTEETQIWIRMRIASGEVVNTTYKIQLESGSATSYEPFTNGASPNPEYPQEVKTVKGYRNLFDNVMESGYIDASGNNSVDVNQIRSTNFISVLSDVTYILSNNGTPFQVNVSEYDDNKVFIKRTYINRIPFTTSENTKYIRFATSVVPNYHFQLEEGTLSHPYVPYGNNYVDVKVNGKNLYKNENLGKWNKRSSGLTITSSGNNTLELSLTTGFSYGFSAKASYPAIAGKTYTLSYNVTKENTTTTDFIALNETEPSLGGSLVGSNTITAVSDKIWVYVIINRNESITNAPSAVLSNIQIEESSSATPYESYKESNVPLPLNGNEIAGIGNYKDELIVDKFGKCYLNKKIGKVVLDGTENWADRPNYTFSDRFVLQDTRIPKLFVRSFSNYFIVTNNIEDTLPILILNNGTQITINFSAKGTTTLAEFKEWLSTHNTYVYYVSEQEDLINLHYTIDLKTFKGINHITNSEEADMQIKYVQDINTIISEMKNAILEIGGE